MNPFNPVVIIQARMRSERLPGKSLLPVGGKPLLAWTITAARAMRHGGKVVVATPEGSENDAIADLAGRMGVSCARGDEEDVLARFYHSAREAKADPVIRLCADSPLLAGDFMDALVDSHIERGADLTNSGGLYPLGTVSEVISFSALELCFKEAKNKYQREHVSPYIHENPRAFKINSVPPPVWMQRNYRLTVDTARDMEMMRALFDEVARRGLPVNFTNAMALLDAMPDLARINMDVQQRDWRRESAENR